MRYLRNLLGQPARPWVYWSNLAPVRLHALYPLMHTWAEERARTEKSGRGGHWTCEFSESRGRQLERRR